MLSGYTPEGIIAAGLKRMEFIGSRRPGFGRLYHRLFYQAMVERELFLSGLGPGRRVLHVGCGAFPFTALTLAGEGHNVHAVDHDPQAVEAAGRIVASSGLQDKIQLIRASGETLDCSSYDAVWVSFCISPRHRCIKNLLATLQPGARIVYRNPRNWLLALYSRVEPDFAPQDYEMLRVVQSLGKESVVIRKSTPKGGNTTCPTGTGIESAPEQKIKSNQNPHHSPH